ncbi:hypothetical protein Hanom_Chr09g00834631 [Helianthus anomalus]
MGMFKRTYKPNEQPVRSNQPSDRPAQSILHHLFTFPRYSSLCYRTIQANPPSDLPSIHNHCEYTRSLLLSALLGVTYVNYQITINTNYLNANLFACATCLNDCCLLCLHVECYLPALAT